MQEPGADFLSMYLEYTSGTECPVLFNRWSAIAGIGAFLGRGYSLLHGHFPINPNIYCMLMGTPGTRKSTSIKLIKNLLIKAGYENVAADKTSKEKFLVDLAGEENDTIALDEINIFGEDNCYEDREILIAADEFNDFVGIGNMEFISLLGSLWDYSGTYKYRLKNSKSIAISNPTISILAGNTPTALNLAFPVEAIGQGFFSRLILVHSDPSGIKIAFPEPPAQEQSAILIDYLQRIKSTVVGIASINPTAHKLLEKIYLQFEKLPDVRFDSYCTRRFSHLLKLCLIISASRLSTLITEQDVIYANTILTHTESLMPKALGEFGKAKNSDVVHKVIQVLENSLSLSLQDIWKEVNHDLDKITELAEIIRNLTLADRIQTVEGKFLIKKSVTKVENSDTVDYSLLTREELGK